MTIKQEHTAINRLKTLNSTPQSGIKLAFSGGKDSVVLFFLAQKAGISFDAVYQNTTIDPPGTLSFIRKNFPSVIIQNPKLSFYQLIEKKGLPTRQRRWCCQYLKENTNKGYKFLLTGVRRNESFKRSEYKIVGYRPNKIVEVRPIIDWNDNDVWEYIQTNDLPVIKYYNDPYNFTRHGCVMCPLAYYKQSIREAILFPRYLKAIIKATRKFREKNTAAEWYNDYADEYEMVYLWLRQELGKRGQRKINNNLFEFNAKQVLETFFDCKL